MNDRHHIYPGFRATDASIHITQNSVRHDVTRSEQVYRAVQRCGGFGATANECAEALSLCSDIVQQHIAEPLMKDGGCLLTTTYYGGEEVIPSYGLMGPVKSALEGTVKYLAAELGAQNIRVNALSPGPIATRAAGGIADFDNLLKTANEKSPLHEAVSIEGVGAYARFLVSDDASLVTGSIAYIDAGYNIIGG